MRHLARTTGRDFASIAMKLANLLAAETQNTEGLPNTSRLDRALVQRYGSDRAALELKALEILRKGSPSRDRAKEVTEAAVDIIRLHRVPINVGLVALILAARDPLLAAPVPVVREALASSEKVIQSGQDVFVYAGDDVT